MDENYKELVFRGVKRRIGLALWQEQIGRKAPSAKPLGGSSDFKGGKVMEIVADGDGDTYRTVYVVEFKEAIYVVDAFQKKSKRGIATPREDIDRIVQRVKALRRDREEPAAKAEIAELLVRYAGRQRAIVEKRKQQDDPKDRS